MQTQVSGSTQTCTLAELPKYLQDALSKVGNTPNPQTGINVPSLHDISQLADLRQQHAFLLLLRHILTQDIARLDVLYPPLVLQRALVYEALGYADLAVADAYIVHTLCEVVRSDEWVSDLQPRELDGTAWSGSADPAGASRTHVEALALLVRCLHDLGATRDSLDMRAELARRLEDVGSQDLTSAEQHTDPASVRDHRPFRLFPGAPSVEGITDSGSAPSVFGSSRREVYPWNTHEPDRNSTECVAEINGILAHVAPHLEARVTALTALDGSGTWCQLGLFANKHLDPGAVVLREKSLLTGIRPLDDALCDACGADLEAFPRHEIRQCPGDDCDLTYCSEECAARAALEYHGPNLQQGDNIYDEDEAADNDNLDVDCGTSSEAGNDDDDNDDDDNSEYPPPHAPFCGNSALHEIGRASSTTTPEWDLYFLLLARTIQMSITQSIHPLDLATTKYLWGDFSPSPDLRRHTSTEPKPKPEPKPKQTLPFSLYHNVALPLQFWEVLMHSVPSCQPYSPRWMVNFDFWIVQTLFAKFRGVANATQSTYDGKPEIAAVHPMWCLANHSCAPNVEWCPTGVREFRVRSTSSGDDGGGILESGIESGKEIWSHYTDVRLGVSERRERLEEVLGGVCRCTRCLVESGEA